MLIRGLIALAFGTLGLGITEYVAGLCLRCGYWCFLHYLDAHHEAEKHLVSADCDAHCR